MAAWTRMFCPSKFSFFLNDKFTNCVVQSSTRSISRKVDNNKPNFGFLFDIDGVILRGKKVLPSAKQAFKSLTDGKGRFRVPCIFVTNAGNTLRQNKAAQLSDYLDVEITADQVVMSHSPLKMFTQFMDKHVLVSGQGPVFEIAKNLGFQKVTTIEALRHQFPDLDMVDHKRRKMVPCEEEAYFPPIEAVILFGEPVRWETNLQLITDVLLTNGKPDHAPNDLVYPHLPVLACNMDLFWMAASSIPRYGHGCFLLCLESLYRKITGRELQYTALVGKPSELTYHHSEFVLNQEARKIGIRTPINTIYCVGDNPETDIYGANLYNRYLHNRKGRAKKRQSSSGSSRLDELVDWDLETVTAEACSSILVCTGVFDVNNAYTQNDGINFNHRDFLLHPELKKPRYTVTNVNDAVQLSFELENFS